MGNIDWFSQHGPILPDDFEELLVSGLTQQVPVMMGDNTVEGVNFCAAEIADPTLLESHNDNWDEAAPDILYPSLKLMTMGSYDTFLLLRRLFLPLQQNY